MAGKSRPFVFQFLRPDFEDLGKDHQSSPMAMIVTRFAVVVTTVFVEPAWVSQGSSGK
jgi:hypothetical protein